MVEFRRIRTKRKWFRRLAVALVLSATCVAWDRHNHPVFWGPQYLIRFPTEAHEGGDTLEESLEQLRKQGHRVDVVTSTNVKIGTHDCNDGIRQWSEGYTNVLVRTDHILSVGNFHSINLENTDPKCSHHVVSNLLLSAGIHQSKGSGAYGTWAGFYVVDLASGRTNMRCSSEISYGPAEVRMKVTTDGRVLVHFLGVNHEQYLAWDISTLATSRPPSLKWSFEWQGAVDERLYGYRPTNVISAGIGRKVWVSPSEPSSLIFNGMTRVKYWPIFQQFKDSGIP